MTLWEINALYSGVKVCKSLIITNLKAVVFRKWCTQIKKVKNGNSRI